MYSLPHFKEQDDDRILAFMRENPFAVVIATGANGRPEATQVPLLIKTTESGEIILTGHVMKKSDHHTALRHAREALVIFTGAHAYVSASWYVDEMSASTWNYMTVHARGDVVFRDEPGTIEAVRELTDHYEGQHNKASFGRLPVDYIQNLAKAIDGFDIHVRSLEHVFKLSQNRSQASRENIITELNKRPDSPSQEIAKEIRSRIHEPPK